MWYLEAFDDETEELVQDWCLGHIDEQTLKDVLKSSSEEYTDEDFGPFSYEVLRLDGLAELAEWIDGPFAVDESQSYFISYFPEKNEAGIPLTTVYVPPRFLPAL